MRPSNVINFPVRKIGGSRPPEKSDGNNRLLKPIACAAGALILTVVLAGVAVVVLKVNPPGEQLMTGSFSTPQGEHACWKLPDISELCLNTASAVRYTYTRNARNLEVLSGEAIFTVRPDKRPFEVLSGRLLVRDISTRFDVYRHGTLTTLTVVEGLVKAKAPIDQQTHHDFDLAQPDPNWGSAQEFHRLQQVEFDESTGTLTERTPLTPRLLSQSLAWQHGEIDAAGKTLGEVLEEFSRYQPIDQFSIPDEELRQFKLPDGELMATDLANFLEMLANVYGIHHTVTRSPDGEATVTLSRPHKGGSQQQRK